MKGIIHSVETMGTVDGPGIRFVVFMQGCSLRCQYCHNPDTWTFGAGKEVTSKELLDKYNRYLPYLKNGGITLSGGEPLHQIDFVIDLFAKAKEKKIHTCLDTSGITYQGNDKAIKNKFNDLTKVADLVMLDIKHMDSEKHRMITGAAHDNILEFARFLDESGVNMWIRHVIVPGLTDDRSSLEELGRFIAQLENVKAIDILPFHQMGKLKYQKMNRIYPLENVLECSKDKALEARKVILESVRKAKYHNT
ncbi:MAG: pyruvate formate lyase-activating protein [Lachnoclostridium sp.]|jgi:pyruvate formate lyase activating enzyme|nr:pyruvate formate lyase-activating protein [Lachnoclostridium sp.]